MEILILAGMVAHESLSLGQISLLLSQNVNPK